FGRLLRRDVALNGREAQRHGAGGRRLLCDGDWQKRNGRSHSGISGLPETVKRTAGQTKNGDRRHSQGRGQLRRGQSRQTTRIHRELLEPTEDLLRALVCSDGLLVAP